MNKTQEFIKLIQENPDLPVVPMVDSEVVCDEGHWWLGSFGHCEITEYTCFETYHESRFVVRDDIDEIEEYFMNEILDDNEDLSAEEVEAMAIEKAKSLDWVKAIIVYIGTP